jgi:hypothetical protein
VCWKFGGIVENHTFRGGFVPVAHGMSDREKETYAWIRAQTDQIPIRASVGVTNRTGAHVSNRMTAVFYPEKANVDWLFIDEAELKGNDLDKHNRNIQNGVFELVARRDRFAIFKRVPKTAPTAATRDPAVPAKEPPAPALARIPLPAPTPASASARPPPAPTDDRGEERGR